MDFNSVARVAQVQILLINEFLQSLAKNLIHEAAMVGPSRLLLNFRRDCVQAVLE